MHDRNTAPAPAPALVVAEAVGLDWGDAWPAFLAAAGGWAPLIEALRGLTPETLGEALRLASALVDENDAAYAASGYQRGGLWSDIEAGPGWAQFGTGRTFARLERHPEGWAVSVGLLARFDGQRPEAARIAAAWRSLDTRWGAAVRTFTHPRPVVWLHPGWALEEPAQPTWAWAG